MERLRVTCFSTWRYVCIDVMALIQVDVSSSIVNIEAIKIYRILEADDIYVDTIFIGSREPTTDFDGV